MPQTTEPKPKPKNSNFVPLVINFAQREMAARYKRSLLGWLWSLLNPASTVLIYSLVFGVFLRTQPPSTTFVHDYVKSVVAGGGENVAPSGDGEIFAIYLFIGLVVWNLFNGVINGSMDWLTGVMDLRKKAYFPTETVILGGTIATLVQTVFELVVLLVIMVAVSNIGWTFLLLPFILLGAASFGLGIGLVVSILNARYRDVRYLIGIILSLQFFLVPIVYPIGLLDNPDVDTYGLPAREIVRWNPVSEFVQAAHDVVYFVQVPSLGRVAVMLAAATISPAIGLTYFRRRSMEISEEL